MSDVVEPMIHEDQLPGHQVVQPLSKAPSGRWHRYEKQLEPVLPVLLPWAERLGYPS